MKKLLMLAVVSFLAFSVQAQNIKVSKFDILEKDMTANTHGTEKLDQNGEKAALIKIQAPEQGFTFNGGSLGIVAREEHDGEIWLYVPRRAKKLTVQHKDYGVLRDYYYSTPIEGGRTYEMYIDISIGRYVTVTSQLAKSIIYIDGENCGQSPIKNRYLSFGRHTVRAVKDRYEGEQTFMITTDDESGVRYIRIEQRDMSDHFGDVIVNVDNKADIYYENRRVGTGSWQTQLREGSYVVETRKADCDPVKTSFTVVAQKKNTVKANAPTPHTGWLSIYTRPGNVRTVYNGSHFIDLSETVSVPIGTYQMEFSRKGYETQHHEYVVRRNQTTTDTVTLNRINYLKPTCFYFGAAFTARSLSGISGIVGATYKNHDLQASYTLGLMETNTTNWSNENGDFLASTKHKVSSFAIKYGYQIPLVNQLALTPQIGYACNIISSTIAQGSTAYADRAVANYLTIGAKVVYAPFKHFYLFLAPEYDMVMSNDEVYEQAMKKAGQEVGGFLLNAGLLINF